MLSQGQATTPSQRTLAGTWLNRRLRLGLLVWGCCCLSSAVGEMICPGLLSSVWLQWLYKYVQGLCLGYEIQQPPGSAYEHRLCLVLVSGLELSVCFLLCFGSSSVGRRLCLEPWGGSHQPAFPWSKGMVGRGLEKEDMTG